LNGVGAPTIRDTAPADFEAILRLNAESVHFLSALTRDKLEFLHGHAARHRVACVGGDVAAFLLAFREGTPYQSPNYQWFADRYTQFLYIDRVVVGMAFRAQRLGSMLYDDLFAHARKIQVPRVTCEFDIEPPNPASARFHARFGFKEVGRQDLAYAAKAVSLQEAMP
jgi:uncharacterized protein